MKRDAGTAASDKRQRKGAGSTRRTIVSLLKTRGQGSAGELAAHLGMTEMGARRHLHALERDGYVRQSLHRQPVGRPVIVYTLTEESETLFPRNYHLLALDLLDELEEDPASAGMAERLFEARKRKLHERYAGRMEGRTLEGRIAELAAIQNAGGYMVEVEAGPVRDGGGGDREYVLHEYNCPIAQVAKKYRQACSCELALFETLLDARVERTACIADGGARCTYRITGAAR